MFKKENNLDKFEQ
jgi:hypothetical protein